MSRNLVLVTGGAGFIGSHLVRGLLARDTPVRVVDNFATGNRQNLDGIERDIQLVEGDILNDDVLREALDGVSVVFHQAAIPSVTRSVDNPMRTHEADATATLALLIAAREAGTDRLIYASSSSVYGGIDALPVHEELATVPVSPYGVAKLAGELYCRAFTAIFEFPTISLRYFNVFGPRQDAASEYAAVIPRFATALLEGEPVTIYGDGQQSRDFSFIDNVVGANLLAAEAGEQAFGRTFNIAHGERHSIVQLIDLLKGIIQTGEVQVRWTSPRPGDVRHSQADIGLARKYLGYEPRVSFETGVERTVEWLDSVRSTQQAHVGEQAGDTAVGGR